MHDKSDIENTFIHSPHVGAQVNVPHVRAKDIAVYGGTFDPVHKGHRHVVECVLHHTHFKHIICMPVSQNPLKDMLPTASDAQRLDMLGHAFKDIAEVSISTYEIEKHGKSYSIDTVKYIRECYDIHSRLGFVVGSDVIESIAEWKYATELAKLIKFIVIPRARYALPAKGDIDAMFDMEVLENMSLVDVESHFLRSNFSLLKQHTQPSVFDYIYEHGLYRDSVG